MKDGKYPCQTFISVNGRPNEVTVSIRATLNPQTQAGTQSILQAAGITQAKIQAVLNQKFKGDAAAAQQAAAELMAQFNDAQKRWTGSMRPW